MSFVMNANASLLQNIASNEHSKTLAFLEALATADVVGASCHRCGGQVGIRLPRCECRSCGSVAVPLLGGAL